MMKLERRPREAFVTLIETCVHLIRGTFGLYMYLSSQVKIDLNSAHIQCTLAQVGGVDENPYARLPKAYCMGYSRIIWSLSTSVFERRTACGSELFSLFNLFSRNHIYIAKYLFSIRDHKYKNLGDTTVLAREIFSSGCRPRLKNARA